MLCHCFKLTEAHVRRLIEEHRCASVEDVSVLTGACRGCQTCRPDIEGLLREVNGGAPPAAGSSPTR